MAWEPTPQEIEEKLVELTYVWGDIEEELVGRTKDPFLTEAESNEAGYISGCVSQAFRVEATFGENTFGDPCSFFVLLFDVADPDARRARADLDRYGSMLDDLIKQHARPWHSSDYLQTKVVPLTAPVTGKICRRAGEQHPKELAQPASATEEPGAGSMSGPASGGSGDDDVIERFEQQIPVPVLAVADWELARRISEVISQQGGNPKFRAADPRGTYEAFDLTALQGKAETRDGPPDTLLIEASGGAEAGKIQYVFVAIGTTESKWGAFARVISVEEAVVDHLISRIRELFRAAERRHPLPDSTATATRNTPATEDAAPSRPNSGSNAESRKFGYLRDLSVETLGGAGAVGLVALAAAIWALFFR